MSRTLGVIGCGNMAKAILRGICHTNVDISQIYVYDVMTQQYDALLSARVIAKGSIADIVAASDCILLSVKPQSYAEVLAEIAQVADHDKKLYISIGAGVTVISVSNALHDARVVRVLPNVPMLIGMGVSVICRNSAISPTDFTFVKSIFESAGSVLEIEESEMNRYIGVTSSSPAYVFRFIRAICEGASLQGLPQEGLLQAVCDMVIGSATMLRDGTDSPDALIAKVASKGGTTEQALLSFDRSDFDRSVTEAMIACTKRADELGNR